MSYFFISGGLGRMLLAHEWARTEDALRGLKNSFSGIFELRFSEGIVLLYGRPYPILLWQTHFNTERLHLQQDSR